jgi:hypothetical protein
MNHTADGWTVTLRKWLSKPNACLFGKCPRFPQRAPMGFGHSFGSGAAVPGSSTTRPLRPPLRTSCCFAANRRCGPTPDSCTAARQPLFDQLIGTQKEGRRNLKPKRLGGLEVDHELELGRQHHRQIARFLALENAAGIDPDLAV